MCYNLTSVIGLPAEAVDEMARAPWWAAMVAAAPTLVYDHAATHEINLDPDWRARWAKVTVPTTVCSGDQPSPGLPEAADAVAAALPNASRRILSGQGHRPAPEGIVPVLGEFLRWWRGGITTADRAAAWRSYILACASSRKPAESRNTL